MAVKVTSNRKQNESEVENRAGLAVRFMLHAIHLDSTPNTPKKDGFLRADVRKSVEGTIGTIRWGRSYAGIQETTQFTNYTTPGTGPHYARNAVQRTVDNSSEFFRRAGM